MAESLKLVDHVRKALSGAGTIHEVKMFGGVGFMLNGNLIAGASVRGLLVRVGKDRHAEALSRPGARAMRMRGKVMRGYIRVDLKLLNHRTVSEWVRFAIPHVLSLPTKAGRAVRRKGRKRSQ